MYGWAEIEPTNAVVAGAMGTWRLTYHVGTYGIDDGGTIKIAMRFASDWGQPQWDNPTAPNYLTVSTTGAARLRIRYDKKGYIRPWQKCLVIDVYETALAPGDTVIVTYGDTSSGSPGTMAQTFCEKTFEFKVAVDSFGTGQFVELDSPPILEIISGAAVKLVAVLPSQVTVDEPFALSVKAEDAWGNPAASYAGTVKCEFLPLVDDNTDANRKRLPNITYTFSPSDRGIHRFENLRCDAPGVYFVKVVDATNNLEVESNPMLCRGEEIEYHPYWGDLHGQSEETVGTNTVDDYFRYARDMSFLDFSSHQGNDFQVTKETWAEIQRRVREYHEPHRFITFLGYEYSSTSPAGGDRNVYYLRDDEPIHRTSHWQIADKSDADTDQYPITELFEMLRGKDALTIPHVGGRPANLEFHDPNCEPLVEIYSAWGEFEWLMREALERGYKVGFVAGSDDHKGRPGASYPGSSTFGVYGGLVCVYARELTREAVWEALKNRRCYATTGQRIILQVFADGHWMGEEYRAEKPPTIAVNAIGTNLIEKIELFRGLQCIHTYPPTDNRSTDHVRIVWSGARIKGRGRIARWDGALEIDGGKILDATGYAFDSPVEGITSVSENSVSWKSATAGDADGIILKLDASKSAKLHFQTDIAAFIANLDDILAQPFTFDAGGLELKVICEMLPLGSNQQHLSFEYTDDFLPTGCTPYYVRLTQRDGAKAWSSPIYVIS